MFVFENVKMWKNTPETRNRSYFQEPSIDSGFTFCVKILPLPVREASQEAGSSRRGLHRPRTSPVFSRCREKRGSGCGESELGGGRGRGFVWLFLPSHWLASRVEPHTEQRLGAERLTTDLLARRLPPPARALPASRRLPGPGDPAISKRTFEIFQVLYFGGFQS